MAENNGNQSLIRGLNLIDLLSNYPNGCPLATLAELSGLNKSTVHRLLQGLQQEGFVQSATTSGSYRLTTKCLSIGHKIYSSMNIISLAAPYLERLNLTTGETVNFSIQEKQFAILIYKLEPTTGIMRTRAYIGQRSPLYCSAMGKLYLAFNSKESFLNYWQQNQATILPFTANTITDLAQMEAELHKIRQDGFAMDNEENELGVSCIAYPIFNYKNEVPYALSISLSTLKLNQIGLEYLKKELSEIAQAISLELGWQKERPDF